MPVQEPKPVKEAEIAKPNLELRDKTKIFVGNLPLWVKKEEICRFFRQFGPLKKVELIRGHDTPVRNVGYFFGSSYYANLCTSDAQITLPFCYYLLSGKV